MYAIHNENPVISGCTSSMVLYHRAISDSTRDIRHRNLDFQGLGWSLGVSQWLIKVDATTARTSLPGIPTNPSTSSTALQPLLSTPHQSFVDHSERCCPPSKWRNRLLFQVVLPTLFVRGTFYTSTAPYVPIQCTLYQTKSVHSR